MKKKTDILVTHRAHVHYSGRVQGVGFRYTAERLALDLGLCGFVQNLPDGRVEIVCEGAREKIELFLEGIRQSGLDRYIRKTECLWEPPTRRFTDFTVEFHL